MGVENILKVGGLEQLVSHKAGVENNVVKSFAG
jgi:hypothetical protein